MIKSKLIVCNRRLDFEDELDSFLEGLESYSVQYKPVMESEIWFTALILYQTGEEENELPF